MPNKAPATQALICSECGRILTNDERHYYESRCESCESEWANDIFVWRQGGENKEYDALYSGEKPIQPILH